MAKTVTRYERTGLDTGTGDRSAARMAGSGPSAGTIVTPVSEGRKTVTDLFKDMVDKQTENERVATAAQKARNAYMSGEPVPLNSAGTQTMVDVNAQKTLTNTANNLKVANQGYAEKGQIDLNNERAKKASGLGQYSNTSGMMTEGALMQLRQDQTRDRLRSESLQDTDRSRSWQMEQQAANTSRAAVDATLHTANINSEAQRVAGIEAGRTTRYSAAQAAAAQRDSAAYAMFGQLAGGASGYKYWGG